MCSFRKASYLIFVFCIFSVWQALGKRSYFKSMQCHYIVQMDTHPTILLFKSQGFWAPKKEFPYSIYPAASRF